MLSTLLSKLRGVGDRKTSAKNTLPIQPLRYFLLIIFKPRIEALSYNIAINQYVSQPERNADSEIIGAV